MAPKKTSPKLPKNSTKAAPKVDSTVKPDPSGSLVKAESPLSNAALKTPPPATPNPSASLK